MRAHAEDRELTRDQHFRDNYLAAASLEIGAGMNRVLARPACWHKLCVQPIGVGPLVGIWNYSAASRLQTVRPLPAKERPKGVNSKGAFPDLRRVPLVCFPLIIEAGRDFRDPPLVSEGYSGGFACGNFVGD
jgi:hypothetical protein